MLENYCIFVIFWIFWISKKPSSTFFSEKEGALAALYLDVKHAWKLVALDQTVSTGYTCKCFSSACQAND